MDRRLLQPKWILATLVMLLVAAIFVWLGLWQLNRLDERRSENAVGERQSSEPSTDLDHLLGEADGDYDGIEYRTANVDGTFDVDSEVLVRSQVYRGTAGFHVITPLIKDDGTAVLINRGWVPLNMDAVPVPAVPIPASGLVEGWVQLTHTRPPLGPQDPSDGRLVVMSRVNIDRIQQQVDYQLEPVYIVVERTDGEDLPVPLALPEFDDEGPHLAYALQWFGFAVILLVGYFFLVRKQLENSA